MGSKSSMNISADDNGFQKGGIKIAISIVALKKKVCIHRHSLTLDRKEKKPESFSSAVHSQPSRGHTVFLVVRILEGGEELGGKIHVQFEVRR